MIDQIYEQLATIERFHATPDVGPYLDKFTARLLDVGYGEGRVRDFIRAAGAFGSFLFDRGVTLGDLDETHVQSFLKHLATRYSGTAQVRRARWRYRSPLSCLLEFLREEGVVRTRQELPIMRSPAAKTLEEYVTFLQTHRGLSESTIDQRRLHVGRFLDQLSGRSLESIEARQIDRFLLVCAAMRSRRSIGCVSTAIRDFMRYLHLSGQHPHDLSQQVASPRRYRFETLPRAISWEEIQALLAAVDLSTALGRRDYAILIVLVVYGLRASEAAALTVDDFDWRANVLRVRRTKGGHACEFPLHAEVGNAVISYLQHGRPDSSDRHVFFAMTPPRRPLHKGSISGRVRHYLKQAGIQAPHWGAHTLRHSYALQLLRSGFSLSAIGGLLGHRNPESTFIYTKTAVEDLREVALETSEVLS